MKRRSAPTTEEIQTAFAAAAKGRGSRLADLIRSFSRDDLVRGLSWSHGELPRGLHYAAGRKEQRQRLAALCRADRAAHKTDGA